MQCRNTECGHPAGAHEDLPDGPNRGANSGPCTTPGCSCQGMIPDGEQMNGPSDNDADGDGNADGTEAVGNPAPGSTGGPIGGGQMKMAREKSDAPP